MTTLSLKMIFCALQALEKMTTVYTALYFIYDAIHCCLLRFHLRSSDGSDKALVPATACEAQHEIKITITAALLLLTCAIARSLFKKPRSLVTVGTQTDFHPGFDDRGVTCRQRQEPSGLLLQSKGVQGPPTMMVMPPDPREQAFGVEFKLIYVSGDEHDDIVLRCGGAVSFPMSKGKGKVILKVHNNKKYGYVMVKNPYRDGGYASVGDHIIRPGASSRVFGGQYIMLDKTRFQLSKFKKTP